MASGLAWFTFIIVLVLVIALVVITILGVQFQNNIIDTGTSLAINEGTTSAATDSFTMTPNNIYLGQSTSSLTLTVSSSGNGQAGDLAYIANQTSNTTISLSNSDGLVNFPNSMTVTPGQLAIFILIDTSTGWSRLQ